MSENINQILHKFPKTKIIQQKTPLYKLNQISKMLDIDLWIKRDDVAGTTLGGNKARQLEYYFGQALKQKADTILITGATQSNFARITAAVAAEHNLKTIIQLEKRVLKSDDEYINSGNVLLNNILGAKIIHYPHGEDEKGADQNLFNEAQKLKLTGKNPYVIPLAPNKKPLGSLGYLKCALEIHNQTTKPFNTIFVPSGSGATHLGIVAGMKILNPKTKVIGCCVRRNKKLQLKRLNKMAKLFNQMTQKPNFLKPSDFNLTDDALAPAYGQLGPLAADAMKIMAQSQGIILDPVYTAKTFAAVIQYAKTNQIKERVLFIHTGGLAATFAYKNDIFKTLNTS